MSEYFRKYIKKEHYPNHYLNIKFKTTFKNCVLEALRRRQWKETDGEDWDIYWAEKEWIHEVMDHVHMNQTQRVNHFRNHYELTRKDLMIKNLKRHKKNLEKEGKQDEALQFNFFPLTFHLPSEYPIFCEEFKKQLQVNDAKVLWIMKPIAKSQGKGIFLFNKIQQISQWKNNFRYNPDNPQVAEPYIVQRYIADPLLLGGKKFDMRIYALCTSYQPLTIYLNRTGFARFTHQRYDMEDINNTYIHLTNVAVQKTSDNYDEKLGGKWSLQTLKLYLMAKFTQDKVTEAFFQIQQIIIRALQSVQKIIINDKHCFELYGFDILFDSQLKPWLLEINASPSMTANTPVDFDLKCGLLDDVFTIIDIEKTLTGQEEQIGGFDLIFKGVPIKLPANSTYTTLLGSFNNRHQQLKKLAKSTAIRLAQTHQEAPQKPIETKPIDPKQQLRSSSKGPGLAQAQNYTNINMIRQQQIQQTNTFPKRIPQGFPKNMPPKRNPDYNVVSNSTMNSSNASNSSQQASNSTTSSLNAQKNLNSRGQVATQQQFQQQMAPQIYKQNLNNQFTTNQKLLRIDKQENNSFEPYKKEEARYFEVMGKQGGRENDE